MWTRGYQTRSLENRALCGIQLLKKWDSFQERQESCKVLNLALLLHNFCLKFRIYEQKSVEEIILVYQNNRLYALFRLYALSWDISQIISAYLTYWGHLHNQLFSDFLIGRKTYCKLGEKKLWQRVTKLLQCKIMSLLCEK